MKQLDLKKKLSKPTYKEQVENEFSELFYRMYDNVGLSVWDCSLFLTPKKSYLILDCIHVANSQRMQGRAKQAMNLLCEFADKYSLTIALFPSDLFGTPVDVLITFYKKFDFRTDFSNKLPTQYSNYFCRKPKK